jgi:hypothetical protein
VIVILSEESFAEPKDPGEPREPPALVAGEEIARLARFLSSWRCHQPKSTPLDPLSVP